MNLPLRLICVAMLQVVLTSIVTYFFVIDEYKTLSSNSLVTLERFLIDQKKQELKNYTEIALSAINKPYELASEDDVSAQTEVAQLLNGLLYSEEDGYFFIYDNKGVNITHPKEPFRVGVDHWELEDENGEKIIQILVNNAKNGGGYYRYPWNKPSVNRSEEKMGYSVFLDKWNWMIGTGVYLDDVNKQLGSLQNEIDQHIGKTKTIILVVAFSSIVIIFLFGLIVNLTQKKRTDLKISLLGQRIINLQEEERRHHSRELHDGIIQVLVSIKYSLVATRMFIDKKEQDMPPALAHASSNLDSAIKEIRRISHHLHPRILDELGLSAAIKDISDEFSERTQIRTYLTMPAARKLLPDNISTTLFRVVQESLVNIEKHANASTVNISLVLKDKRLTLSICDNGCGFSTDSDSFDEQYGIGLRNLSERIQHHAGEFNVMSSEQGTCIVASIPTTSFVNHFNKNNIEEEV